MSDRVSDFKFLGRRRNGILYPYIKFRFAFFSMLGSDKNHPVGSPGAIQRCGAGIFQNRKTFDIIGLQTSQIGSGQFNIVYQYQRAAAAISKSGNTPYKELGIIGARLS